MGRPAKDMRREAQSKSRGSISKKSKPTKEAAQKNLILLVQDGYSIKGALESDKVQRTRKAYEQWRNSDKEFAGAVDAARAMSGHRAPEERPDLGFAEWRRRFLGVETFWHQHQWIDILEGREPRDLHPSQQYTKGRKSRVIINVPPFHAKTATVSTDYVTYRICKDPGVRIIIVSKSQMFAANILYGVKQRLTHPDFIEMQKAYAPDGGWKQSSDAWTTTRITVGATERDAYEKDPTAQAVGLGGQIYGARADIIIVDDAVVNTNVKEFEKQLNWLRVEASSRLEAGGKLVVVGTRIQPVDLYSEIMNPENYSDGKSPWTHLASPAILEEGSTPDEHVTLWPYATIPWQDQDSEDECDLCDGADYCKHGFEDESGAKLFPRWDGVHLENGPRSENSAASWALVYQQSSLSDDMTFPQHAVTKATSQSRAVGTLKDSERGHPEGGMHNMYVIGACDPSIKGYAGIIVGAVDRTTGMRYVLNVSNLKAPKVGELKDAMKDLTDVYGIDEWRVEKTGLLQFFTQEEELRRWFQSRGVRFSEHNTNNSTKWDPQYGVASLGGLFGHYERERNGNGTYSDQWLCRVEPLIELPKPTNQSVKALIHQLVTWTPDTDPKKVPCDLVMALWFFDVRAREIASRAGRGKPQPYRGAKKFVSRADKRKNLTVSLAELRTAQPTQVV